VVAVAAELATVPLATQTAVLTMVNRRLSPDVWGEEMDTGRVYLAAHLATVGLRKGIAGSPQSMAAGPVSTSYAISMAVDNWATTSYGQEFDRLLKTLPLARLPIIA